MVCSYYREQSTRLESGSEVSDGKGKVNNNDSRRREAKG